MPETLGDRTDILCPAGRLPADTPHIGAAGADLRIMGDVEGR
jgi:hypothetical protein